MKKNPPSDDSNGGIYLDNDIHLPWMALESNWVRISTSIKCPKKNDDDWWIYKKKY